MRAPRLFLKAVLVIYLAAFILSPPAAQAAVTETAAPSKAPFRYEDIAGITAEEIAAIEAYRATGASIRLAASQSADAFWTDQNGADSFVYLMCRYLEDLFDIPFILQIHETQKSAYEIMLRSDFYYAARPILDSASVFIKATLPIEHNIHLFRNENTAPIEHIVNRGETPRFAFLAGSSMTQIVQESATYPFDVTYVNNMELAATYLENEQVDAFLADSTAEAFFSHYPFIRSDTFLPLASTLSSLSTQNKKLTPILSAIEKHFKNEGLEKLQALYVQGQLNYDAYSLFLMLTDAEKAYLFDHINSDTPIYYAASFDNYPICYYDDKADRYLGVSIDIINRVSALTHLRFEPGNPPGEAWYLLLSELTEKKYAFASELIVNPERLASGHFIWPDTPYANDNYALISLIDMEDITLTDIPQYRIGVLKGMAYTNVFNTWFPDIQNTVEYTTYEKAYRGLANKEIDFLVGTNNLLLNFSNRSGFYGLKAAIVFDYNYESNFGFNEDEEILCSIFSKAHLLIDTDDISLRWKLKAYDYSDEIQRSLRNAALILGAVVLVIVIVISIAISRSRIKKHEEANRNLEAIVQQRTAELETQTRAAQVASKAKSSFLARMSHELRTPLNAILGMSTLAQQSTEDNSAVHATIGNVITAAGRLLGTFNDILVISNIETDHFVLDEKPFSLYDTMRDVCDTIKPRCEEKGLQFIYYLDDLRTISLIGDKPRLKQIMLNLLGNAVKFTNAGGVVELFVHCKQAEGKGILNVRVTDNGIGIAKDRLPTLFVPYEKASQLGGTGLGLSISQRLVNLMGGEITVQSAEMQGATFKFTISLPLGEAVSTGGEILQAGDLNLSRRRLLVVDDIEINRLLLVELLSDTKAKIEEAADGAEAYQMFIDSPPYYYDLILMDIQMPNMNGYVATKSIRALNRSDAQTIPIISVSANTFHEDIAQSLAAGMNCHLAKPIEMQVLLQTLKEYLS